MPENQDHDTTGGFRYTRPDDPLTKIRMTRQAAYIAAAAFAAIAIALSLVYSETGVLPWWSGAVGCSISAVVMLSRGAGLSGQTAHLEITIETRRTASALRREVAYLRSDLATSNAKVTNLTAEVVAVRDELAELKGMIRDGFAGANQNIAAVDMRLAAAENCVRNRLDDVVELEVQQAKTLGTVAGNGVHTVRRNGR